MSDDTTNPSNAEQNIPLLPTISNGSSELEFLRHIESLFIKQLPSAIEALFGFSSEAEFDIFDDKNVRLLHATETSSWWQRLICATRRQFVLNITNNNNHNIIRINRELKCCSGCCWCAGSQCCSQEVMVESPPGNLIGTVSQQGSCCRPIFAIKDEQDNHILTVRGPVVACDGPSSCCCQPKYALIGTDGITEIGAIYKKYHGFVNEAVTSADSYLLKVPLDLDIKAKALSLATLFLIEYMAFSAVPNNS